MDLTVTTYIVYLTVSVALTVWVAHTLSRNGLVFLEDVFAADPHKDTPGATATPRRLADAVNHLLVVGFYLVNLGFVGLWMKLSDTVHSVRGSFEALSVELGTVLLVLGALHLGNVFVLSRIRRNGLERLAEAAYLATPPGTPAP